MFALILFVSLATPAQASPWAKKEGYWNKTGGKFVFGLKHTLFSWTSWWTESKEPQYSKEWEGFNVGLGKTVVYTAAGMIQLVTFFIPVDFPNIGIGIHIPNKDCPQRHDENFVPGQGAAPKKAGIEPPPADTLAPKEEAPEVNPQASSPESES